MTAIPSWTVAFVASAVFSSLGVPILRRLTQRTDRTEPSRARSGQRPIALGGVAVVLGVLVAMVSQAARAPAVGAVALASAALVAVSLLSDEAVVTARDRRLAQAAAVGLAAVVGVRISATGVGPMDMALMLLWIASVTAAFRSLDTVPGLTAGIAAAASAAVFALAIMAQQHVPAIIAAAMVGSCLGHVLYDRRRRSAAVGDPAALFLGFVVAVVVIDVAPAAAPASSLVIPLVVLALPTLDIVTVALGRLRRGRDVFEDADDHLPNRLVARGLSPKQAVATLVSVQAMLGVIAVLGARQVVAGGWTALGAALVLLALAAVTSGAAVYEEPVIGLPRTATLALGVLVVGAPLLSIPALLAVAHASSPARTGAAAARQALDALSAGDATLSATEFERAGRSFDLADQRLGGPLVSMGLAVPGVSTNLHASRTLVSIGRELSAAGLRLAPLSEGGALRVDQGSVSLADVRAMSADLSDAARVLRTSQQRLEAVDRPFLLPPLDEAVREVDTRLRRTTDTAERVAETARLLPGILGGEGTRRYFLAFQNNAEIRGAGGFLGNWGELVAENGHLELGRFGRVDDLNVVNSHSRVLHMPPEFARRWREFQPQLFWQQANISPDFPTTARIISDLYPQSGGQELDGVIGIDPIGLSALLELTGPVEVPAWPELVTASNVVDITLRSAYERFTVNEERVAFLSDLSQRVAAAFTSVDLGSPVPLAEALSRAVRGGHLAVSLNQPDEQQLIERLGADGAVPQLRGDSVMIVNQNVSANKVDYYLRRRLRYHVRLDPGRSPASLAADLEVTLENQAPATGLPSGVIGPYDNRFVAGENRTHLSIYSPFPASAATVDGGALDLRSDPDLGRQAHSATVSIPSLSSRTVALGLTGRVKLSPDGWYRLDLPHQPTLAPDDVDSSVTVPPGWRIAEVRGGQRVDEHEAAARLQVNTQHTLWVRVERTSAWHRVLDRVVGR